MIGIETDRGPWAQALLAAGYRVWAINPLQVARYRERHSVSGAKATPLPRTPSSRDACLMPRHLRPSRTEQAEVTLM